MVIDNTQKILGFIRVKGPVIPAQIISEINSSLLVASATLGELASKNHLRISSLKIGGTPLYYLPGQEAKLQNFAEKLPSQEKGAYDLLRQQVVLRDKDLTPLTRVALRQVKDFAKPLQVNNRGNLEIFWKWYLTSNEEAEKFIKKILDSSEIEKEVKSIPKEAEEQKPKEKEIITEVVKEKQETLKSTVKEEQLEETKPRKKTKKSLKEDNFLERIICYFDSNNIKVIEQNVVRKNAELDFIVSVPSAVGSLTYFCKAKSKRTVNEGDLSSAYFQGQTKKMPSLFLGFGALTKKAQAMFEKEFKGMSFKKV